MIFLIFCNNFGFVLLMFCYFVICQLLCFSAIFLKSAIMFVQHVRIYVCMYVCVHACMHACMHACIYGIMHVCKQTCTYICMHVCLCVRMGVCTPGSMDICLHVCMYYACLYVHAGRPATAKTDRKRCVAKTMANEPYQKKHLITNRPHCAFEAQKQCIESCVFWQPRNNHHRHFKKHSAHSGRKSSKKSHFSVVFNTTLQTASNQRDTFEIRNYIS